MFSTSHVFFNFFGANMRSILYDLTADMTAKMTRQMTTDMAKGGATGVNIHKRDGGGYVILQVQHVR